MGESPQEKDLEKTHDAYKRKKVIKNKLYHLFCFYIQSISLQYLPNIHQRSMTYNREYHRMNCRLHHIRSAREYTASNAHRPAYIAKPMSSPQ